jgi:phosphopantothenoylcysteine decarboxylase/phosphopantothenate--cysteine ligase
MATDNLQGKRIILGITGSIAAYKSCLIARLLVKAGAEVKVIMTPASREFITPLTLSTLTNNPVTCDFFDHRDGSWHSHVAFGLWADAMLIAPCTASTLSKMANGIADNMLITTYLSMRKKVFIAPAMDMDMYSHAATQRNIATLIDDGVSMICPEEGQLASGLIGKGRMAEPETIVSFLNDYLARTGELSGKNILITAGPTYEQIDPVRFIGNFSSGKMGYALAEECALRGAKVTLVSGPVSITTHNNNIRVIPVMSAKEMYDQCVDLFGGMDIGILAAAVADFTPLQKSAQKIKRKGMDYELKLTSTRDIAAALGRAKKLEQKLIGFALETENEMTNAQQKLQDKNFDFIVLNSLQDKGAGFSVDTNKITIISKASNEKFPLKSKKAVAKDIVDRISML